MKVLRITFMTAIAACISTAAMAGGFEYTSIGGNMGNWAYGNSMSSGDAKVYGYKSGSTYSYGGADTYTTMSTTSSYCYYCSNSTTTTASVSSGGNYSGFQTYYGGGSAQSHTASFAGSGVGGGIGGKFGKFSPQGD